jgi:sulfur carrier protein
MKNSPLEKTRGPIYGYPFDYNDGRARVSNGKSTGMSATSTNTIEIILNGEPRQIPQGLSVAGLLAHIGIVADRVAVELNRTIVRKPDWCSTAVPDCAHIEVVQFVGGG